MSDRTDDTPAFPSPPVIAPNGRRLTRGSVGMSLRAYAAIHLRHPDSGIGWLDNMIRAANGAQPAPTQTPKKPQLTIEPGTAGALALELVGRATAGGGRLPAAEAPDLKTRCALDALEKFGFVTSAESPLGRNFALTDKGREQLAALREAEGGAE